MKERAAWREHPSRPRRLASALGLVFCGALLVATGVKEGPSDHAVLTSGTDFPISGSVTNLIPGVAAPLIVTVSNPYDFQIVLTSVGVSTSPNPVVPALPADCAARELSLIQGSTAYAFGSGTSQAAVTLSPQPAVAAHATSSVTSLSLLLARSAGNNCQHVTFPLVYTATATPQEGVLPAFTGGLNVWLIAIGGVVILAGLILLAAGQRRREPS